VFEAGNHVEVVYYYKEGRSVYFIKEAALVSAPGRRRDSLSHMAALLAALELLEQVCYWQSPDAHIVDVALDYTHHQDCRDPLFMFLALEVKLLHALGTSPDVSACARCGNSLSGGTYNPRDGASFCREHAEGVELMDFDAATVTMLEFCADEPFDALSGHDVPARHRKELGKLVHWTYTHHVHGYSLPKSLSLI